MFKEYQVVSVKLLCDLHKGSEKLGVMLGQSLFRMALTLYKTLHFLDLLMPRGGGGQICPQALSFFPELLEGVTCSKMNFQLSSRKNLQFKTHFWCLSHLVPKI